MNYRRLGKTELMVSEVGFGGEWVKPESMSLEDTKALCDHLAAAGVNILDCWMADPLVRSMLGDAIEGERDRWIIQGHIGSTWQETPIDPKDYQGPKSDTLSARGQYVRTRDLDKVAPAFEDLLARFHTDYIDLGMIHYVDDPREFDELMAGGPFIEYVRKLKGEGTIRHIGISTHNTEVARKAALSGEIEMIMFSINPAFDLMPPTEDVEKFFGDYSDAPDGMDPERASLYALCEREDVGLTVMKPFAGGRLFSEADSPFGVALTPVQCIHYCLTRPAVASVLAGYKTPDEADAALAYEVATEQQKDYASILANAPRHAYFGQCTYCGHCAPCVAGIDIAMVNKFHDLAQMQDVVPPSVKAHYEALAVQADACLGCGGCETRCPFGVHIADRMAQAAALFA